MPLKVVITRDFDHMSEVAGDLVVDRIATTLASRDAFTLGLATGNSPTGLYKWLAKAANAGEFDAARVTSVNLDEYVGLPGATTQDRVLHPQSYSYFMIQELFGLLRTKFAHTYVPLGCLIDQAELEGELEAHPDDWTSHGSDKGQAMTVRPDAASARLRWVREQVLDAYEQAIRAVGGIDLHVIGVGGRGHVAFHECGIPFEGNRMMLVKLDDNTVSNAVADGHFDSAATSPHYAITMGAELVYQARCVVLLANGSRKAEPVAASLAEDVTADVPISYGQRYAASGGELIYVIDHAAAVDVLDRREQIEARGVVIDDRSGEGATRRVSDLVFTRDPEHGGLG